MTFLKKVFPLALAVAALLALADIALAQAADLPAQLAGLAGSVPVCANVSEKAAADVKTFIGILVLIVGALRPLSYFLGLTGGKLEDGSQSPAMQAVGKIISYLALAAGTLTVGDVPKTVRYRLKFMPFDKPPQG